MSVALSLDTSRPLRSAGELTALVQAISEASSNETEPDWLEWKREAYLDDRRWQAQIAKFIAGFANRDPTVAKGQVGGCAYLVIGTEPGNVGGISVIDNADLYAGISRFVGTTVRWSPHYVQESGNQVLVITVEPPAYGDQIVAMLTDYQSPARNVCRKGDVFIRRHGRTDIATQDDYNMLCQRFAARVKQAEGMKVQAVGGVTGIPVACGPDEVERWLSRQREELLTPLRRAMFGRIRPFNEGRNAGEYRAEVESYLSELTQVIPLWARADALVGRAPNLQLMLINKTEYNFAAARVEIEINGEVWAYQSVAEAFPDIPNPPRGWGEFRLPQAVLPTSAVESTGTFGPYIDNSGSTHIEFDDVDLRPHEKVHLAPIYLVADATLAGTTLTAKWVVTSTSSDGAVLGEIPVAVSSEIAHLFIER